MNSEGITTLRQAQDELRLTNLGNADGYGWRSRTTLRQPWEIVRLILNDFTGETTTADPGKPILVRTIGYSGAERSLMGHVDFTLAMPSTTR